jgi:hypothetical protein
MTKPPLQAVDPNTPPTQPPDPFDLTSLRLSPSFLETAGVEKLLTTVPARNPHPQDFVRVHPSPEYRENFVMIDLKSGGGGVDREDFLVRPELVPEPTSCAVLEISGTAIACVLSAAVHNGGKSESLLSRKALPLHKLSGAYRLDQAGAGAVSSPSFRRRPP